MNAKTALVTGGNSGIGREIAMHVARAGANVVIAARNPAKGEAVEAEIRAEGGVCTFVRTDVSKSSDVVGLAARVAETYGGLDYAINNAAVEGQKPILDWTEEEWDETVSINLKGVWLCMKAEIEQMLGRGAGAIVNISSVAGLRGFPMHTPYVAAKHGVHGLTKTASREYAARGIRVNTICPGVILTPMRSGSARTRRASSPASR